MTWLRPLAAVLLAFPAAAAERFAVVAGNNEGAPGRPRLWFAERDAERMARALGELGEFRGDHITVLRAPTPEDVRTALAAAETGVAKARAAGERALLFFYFSGHAGTGGLEMGPRRLAYDELRALVNASSAETKIAIVDACDSGRLTQTKGATFSAAVDFTLPEDEVHGTAFIASSSPGEAAQESAAIGGSFFTHHLDVGLRGAADRDGDGHVTLAEAFRYASVRTTSGTAATEAGPQHPLYDIRMSGRGDVVLADLRRAESTLRLPADPRATWFLRGPRGLFAEVPGSSEDLALALPAGLYTVERRGPDGLSTTEVQLARAETRTVPALSATAYEQGRSKGGGPGPFLGFLGGGIAAMPLPHFGIAPFLRAGGRKEIGNFGLRFHVDVARKDVFDEGLRYLFWGVGGAAALVTPVLDGPALVEAGLQAGYQWSVQSIAGGPTHMAAGPTGGLVVQASRRFGPLRLGLDGSVGMYGFRLDDAITVRPVASLALIVLYSP